MAHYDLTWLISSISRLSTVYCWLSSTRSTWETNSVTILARQGKTLFASATWTLIFIVFSQSIQPQLIINFETNLHSGRYMFACLVPGQYFNKLNLKLICTFHILNNFKISEIVELQKVTIAILITLFTTTSLLPRWRMIADKTNKFLFVFNKTELPLFFKNTETCSLNILDLLREGDRIYFFL